MRSTSFARWIAADMSALSLALAADELPDQVIVAKPPAAAS